MTDYYQNLVILSHELKKVKIAEFVTQLVAEGKLVLKVPKKVEGYLSNFLILVSYHVSLIILFHGKFSIMSPPLCLSKKKKNELCKFINVKNSSKEERDDFIS